MQNIADDITLKNAWRLTKEIRAKGVDDSLKNSVSRVNKGIYDTYEAVAKDFAENKSAQSL
jgi:predicted phage-related endonuclease